MDFLAGVPIDCPNCGVGHLHAAVYIEAEGGDMYEVVGLADEEETVIVKLNPNGQIRQPEEVFLSCCACDWNADHFIRWSTD